jgi:phosphoglucomutase
MCPLAPEILEQIQKWLQPPFDEATRAEIQALRDAQNEKELYERFYQELEFGTGGLRGLMGAGLNRMNRYTVGRATQGLANYMLAHAPGKREDLAAVIACDSRLNSDVFAREAACVLAASGIRVYLFDRLRPTPELSFAVRHLRATAGIVVTASHNPKEYNGYKVYWADGGQVVPPQDTGIIDEVKAIRDFSEIKTMPFEAAVAAGKIVLIGEAVDNAYLEAILPLSVKPHVCRQMGGQLRILYTPLHGAGCALTPLALQRWGFSDVRLCASQSEPDGNFPTVVSPNPEERAALACAIADATTCGAHLVLATDPDADRVGIAVLHNGEYHLLTGNQIASLIVQYILGAHAERGSLLPNAAVVKTIVTTELIAAICESYGVRLDNVLTGFKYIGEKIRQYEASGEALYMAGGEESYGYLVGTHARDKDAVVACCIIAEMAADSLTQGQTLVDRIDAITCQFGVFQESLQSLQLAGAEGQTQIARIMTVFREKTPKEFMGIAVTEVRDYLRDEVREAATGRVLGATGLPKSNVLVFRLAGGEQIVARPSGTEPKIKFYFGVCDRQGLPIRSKDELAKRRTALSAHSDALRAAFIQRVEEIVAAKG